MAEVIVSCPNCSARYNVAKYESGQKFKCKSCGKTLLVPEKPAEIEDDGPPLLEDESSPRSDGRGSGGARKGTRGPRGGRRGGTRGPARRGGGRSRDMDDEYDERPMPLRKKGPNWPLILGAGGGVILVLIIGVVVLNNLAAQQAEQERLEREAREAQEKSYDDGGLGQQEADKDEKGRVHTKYDNEEKDKPKPGEQVGNGKIAELEDDKEAAGQETIRTKWKQADVKDKAKRWRVRKKEIILPADVKEKAERALKKFKEVFGDPAGEREAMDELATLGKDAIPAALNFMTTDINHMSQDGAMMGSQLFNLIRDKAIEIWEYHNEFNYGMFESGEERWNAIIEMKMKCLEEGYEIEEMND